MFPIIRHVKGLGSLRVACTRAGTQVVLFGIGLSGSPCPTGSPSAVASGLGAAKPLRSKAAALFPRAFLLHGLVEKPEGCLVSSLQAMAPMGRWGRPPPGSPHRSPPPLPLQMSTSAWRAPTTATSMPSARTPPSPTSASASPATPATGSTAKVGARHRHRSQSPSDE